MTLKPPAGPNVATVWSTYETRLGSVESGSINALVSKEAPINVEHSQYGASPTATNAANRAAIQAAIDVAEAATGKKEILLPRTYTIDATPLTVEADNIIFRGMGRNASGIKSASGNIFTLGSAAANVFYLKFQDMLIESLAGGGHCFTGPGSTKGIGMCGFENLRVKQANAAKSIYDNNLGPYLDVLWENCELEHVTSATVPAFNLVAATSIINTNTWFRCRCTNSGEFFFRVEMTGAGSYQFSNAFRDLNMEVCDGGGMKLLSCQGSVLDNVAFYDNTTTTRDLVYVGKATSGPTSRKTQLRGVHRVGGTLGGGLVDAKFETSNAIRNLVDFCWHSSSTYTVDCGSNPVEFRGPYGDYTRTNERLLTVGSAEPLAFPVDVEDYIRVDGTTNITNINVTRKNHRLTLHFTGALTVFDGTGNLRLNGNFVTTADDTLTLVCDGTNWFEVARSAN